MRQLKSFMVSGGGTGQDIGASITKAVNPFLAEHADTKIESVNVNMMGSFHTACVIVSYQVPDPTPVVEKAPEKRFK